MPVARVRTKKRNISAPSSAPSSTRDDEPGEEAAGPESKLTPQQIGELRACFDSFDKDGSGSLCAPAPPLPATLIAAARIK